jgi:hypothetical protein
LQEEEQEEGEVPSMIVEILALMLVHFPLFPLSEQLLLLETTDQVILEMVVEEEQVEEEKILELLEVMA